MMDALGYHAELQQVADRHDPDHEQRQQDGRLDRETKLLRVMDLMQLNLRGTYYEDFLMREHYIGFRFECDVDGERYAYTEKY
jgi:hypothetical protein